MPQSVPHAAPDTSPMGTIVHLAVPPAFAMPEDGRVSVGMTRSSLTADEAREHVRQLLAAASQLDGGPTSILSLDDTERMAAALGTSPTPVALAFLAATRDDVRQVG